MATRSSPSGSTFLIVALVCAAFVPCATAAAFDLDTRYLATGWELMPGSPVAQAHLRVPVFLGLKVSDKRMQVLTSTCESVSDPASETYGQYLTRSEVTQLTAASDDTHAAVEAWLASVGASSVSFCKTGDCVTALLTVDAIQDSFGLSNMRWFRSPHGPAVRSTDMVSIPAALSSHVEIVLGVADFPPSRHGSLADRMASVARSLRGESDGVVSPPSTDNEMYPMEPVISIAALTSTNVFAVVHQPCPGNNFTHFPLCANSSLPVTQFNVTVIDEEGTHTHRLVTPVVPPGKTSTVVVNVTMLEPYKFYKVFIQAVSASGIHSGPATLAFHDLPTGFRGVVATPTMTPQEIARFYGLPNTTVRTGFNAKGASQAVGEFGPGESLLPSDLALYQKEFGLPVHAPTFVGENTDLAGLESTMDIELLSAVSPSVASKFYHVKSNSSTSLKHGWVLQLLANMNDEASPALVLSISYGLPEEFLVPVFGNMGYASRTNYELLKLCARGVTVVVCSQDAGATDDGHGTNSCEIAPVFPASSPYALSVGASIPNTDAAPRSASVPVGEAVISLTTGGIYTSGGGFSNLEACQRPSYQADVVSKYVKSVTMPTAGTYNTTGRGYPDVTAVGRNYAITLHGYTVPLGDGTSSSTPVWAGILSLVNAERLAAGKAPLGFVNPLLYKIHTEAPSAFYDVEIGSNYCGAFMCCPTTAGYLASAGWDAASGLGSLGDFATFLDAAMSVV